MSLLTSPDWAVIAIYFLLVFGIAIMAGLRERAGKGTSSDYFLAGRDAGWFLVGGSLFASNIGSERIQELAEERGGAQNDVREAEDRLRTLAQQYHAAEGDEAKAEIKADLEKAIDEAFEVKLEMQQEQMERMRKQLEEMEKRLEERKADKAEVCAERLEQLLKSPRLRW